MFELKTDPNIQTVIHLDSINAETGDRITTFVSRFPRIILAQFNKHRMLSTSTSSSRAVPLNRMIERVLSNPFIPVYWGANQKGMEAETEISEENQALAKARCLEELDKAVDYARYLHSLGVHKQTCNRYLEAWMFVDVICTATTYDNFFKLRAHSSTQPEFQDLAYKMKALYDTSVPKVLQVGEWHLPFIKSEDEPKGVPLTHLSTARSARVSYLNHDGKLSSLKEDLDLYRRLVVSNPKHEVPSEHPAIALPKDWKGDTGNFRGWGQHRKELECGKLYGELLSAYVYKK